MIILMVLASLFIAVAVNVLSSCYVCYNVAIESDSPRETLTSVTGIILLNAIVPFSLGCLTYMWYVS